MKAVQESFIFSMAALRAADYTALDAAIRAEKAILEEQSTLLKEQQAEVAEMLKRRS